MTAKNRHKSSSSEKNASSGPDDAPKKIHKSSSGSSSSNGVSGPAPQGSRSGSCLGTLVAAVFYVALLGAAGFAAFYLQQVVEEMRQASAGHEESARLNAQLSGRMESIAHQVESLRSIVDGLESSLGITRVELEGAVSRMKRGEVETRRVEEALQKLQNELLRDLSEGIKEVKEARERDFSSLEKTVEQRLAEVSQSIQASVAEFTEAQGETQGQLADLKSRLGEMEDPALIKQELSSIVEVVAEIRSAKQEADTSSDSLREQIGSVREELQTRNQEVVSLSEEVESVRTVVQQAVGTLKQSLSAAEVGVQALTDKGVMLEGGLEQAAEAVQEVEKQLNAVADQVKRRSDDLEVRVKAAEESGDSLSASILEVSTKVESLLAKYDAHESTVAAQGQAVEEAISGLEAVRGSLEELQAGGTQGGSPDPNLEKQVTELKKRLADVEESKVKPEQVESLRSLVAGLEGKAAKLEGHDQAISSMQKVLQETTKTLAALSKAPGKKSEK
ncbi:cytoskeleton-associated protein 4 [Aulostomus maculatus]